jgi:hypothetical protein
MIWKSVVLRFSAKYEHESASSEVHCCFDNQVNI